MNEIITSLANAVRMLMSQTIIGNIIQLMILVILFITYLTYRRNNNIAQRIAITEITMMGWKMYISIPERITERVIKNVKLFPENWFKLELYEKKYRNNQRRMEKYLYLFCLYEHFVFMHANRFLEKKANRKAKECVILDWQWRATEIWIKEIMMDEMFVEIRELNKIYYSDFEKYLIELESEKL